LPFNPASAEFNRALAIGWTGGFYEADYRWLLTLSWPRLGEWFDLWQNIPAMVDAGLINMALTVGATAGLVLAARRLSGGRRARSRRQD